MSDMEHREGHVPGCLVPGDHLPDSCDRPEDAAEAPPVTSDALPRVVCPCRGSVTPHLCPRCGGHGAPDEPMEQPAPRSAAPDLTAGAIEAVREAQRFIFPNDGAWPEAGYADRKAISRRLDGVLALLAEYDAQPTTTNTEGE